MVERDFQAKLIKEIKDILTDYIDNYYDINDDKDTWYMNLKEFIGQYGYAKTVKEYSQNPEQYIGHVGTFCEMIRVFLFCSLETPDIYELLQILTKEKIIKRLSLIRQKHSFMIW